MTKTEKIFQHFMRSPKADVKKTAAKFKAAVPMVYKVRKQALLATEAVDEVLRMPEMPEPRKVEEDTVDTVLNNRAKNYGKFMDGAEIMQMTKRLLHNYIEQRGTSLAFDQLESIDMIIHKLGRIINGNPDHIDNWVDIAGYATLVADRLKGNAR